MRNADKLTHYVHAISSAELQREHLPALIWWQLGGLRKFQ
jgi:hypothetical protein